MYVNGSGNNAFNDRMNEFKKKRNRRFGIMAVIIIVVIIAMIVLNKASVKRFLKDITSEYANGLPRTVEVYSQTGELLKEYDGRMDVETNEGYILFEDKDGKRHIVWPGGGTVIIDEK